MSKHRRSQQNVQDSHPFNKEIMLALMVGFATFLVYANSLSNGLVYDDHFLIERNELVRNFDVWGVFTTHYWGGYEGNETGQYRPFTVLSFLFDSVGGIHPFRFHLSNVLLHVCNSVLAFVLCRQVGLGQVGALFAGLLFGVHPIHAEAAAGVTFGRADLLAALGCLSSLLCYIWAQKKHQHAFYALALGMFLFGLLSKESALTVIGPIVIYDLSQGKSLLERVKKRGLYWGGFLCIFLCYLLLRKLAAGLGFEAGSLSELNNPLIGHPLDVRLYTAAALFWKYITLIFWPATLSVDYSYNAISVVQTPWHISVLLGVFLGLSGIVVWLWSWKNEKRVFFAGALFWAPYAAVSQTVILINAMFQERFMYLPVLGIFIVVALGVEYLWQRRQELAFVFCLLIVVGCAGRTWQRNKDWHNDFTLYQSAVNAYPNSAKMLHALADELALRGQFSDSKASYRKALSIREDGLTWNNLGNVFAATEEFEAAARAYQKAVEFDGNYVEAWMNWGLTAMRSGQVSEAVNVFERASKLAPQNAEAHYNLGIACSELGLVKKAAYAYAKAVALRPMWAEAHFNLANAYRDMGQKEKALVAYRKFVSLWRGDPEILQLAQQQIEYLEQ